MLVLILVDLYPQLRLTFHSSGLRAGLKNSSAYIHGDSGVRLFAYASGGGVRVVFKATS